MDWRLAKPKALFGLQISCNDYQIWNILPRLSVENQFSGWTSTLESCPLHSCRNRFSQNYSYPCHDLFIRIGNIQICPFRGEIPPLVKSTFRIRVSLDIKIQNHRLSDPIHSCSQPVFVEKSREKFSEEMEDCHKCYICKITEFGRPSCLNISKFEVRSTRRFSTIFTTLSLPCGAP